MLINVLGCTLLVPLTPAPVVVGPVTVIGGNAALNLPIPLAIYGNLFLQWLETPVPLAIPLYFSDGGGVHIFN